MSEAYSRSMTVEVEHLRGCTERNIHFVRWPNEADHVEATVRQAAALLDYHVARLDGRTLHTEQDVLLALADAFHFPGEKREAAACDWNVTEDLVGDLAWLFAPPSVRKGVVALFRDPEPFMVSNLLQCTFLIDALGTQAQWVMKKGLPFHVVVGPLPKDYRYEIFLNQMLIVKHYCEGCQSVDAVACDEQTQE